jgi:hypothetical protein
MEGDWLTYAEAAERLNATPEAVRQKAIRGRWQRTIGNDKRARIRLPDGWTNPVRTPPERPNKTDGRTPSEPRPEAQLIKALEAHVETLKAHSPPLQRGSTSRRTIWQRMIPHMPLA